MITNPTLGEGLQGKTGTGFFAALIPSLVGLTLVVGVLIFFFTLVIGSIQWITSGGDKNSLEAARSKITNGLIGLIVLFVSFAIIQFIETFFSINILTIDFGPLIIE